MDKIHISVYVNCLECSYYIPNSSCNDQLWTFLTMKIKLTVNNKNYSLDIAPHKRLIDFLREDLGLTSVKEGCSEGECGACTVIMDGKAITSCTTLAIQARNKEIITLEGLSQNGELDIIQKSFVRNGAIQCGFCSPGMIMSIKALLMQNPSPTDEEIKTAIEGNLCRCTGYVNIIKATKEVVEEMR
jgi:aerobic-type carbon monoxide dehydrogenase small subunit (CoxS/CutS family)